MTKAVHPEIHEVSVHCVCGKTFPSISTSRNVDVDICSSCHPFFTGSQKFVDAAGRIEKFQQRYDKAKKK